MGQPTGHIFIPAIAPRLIVITSLYIRQRTDRKRKAIVYQHLEGQREKGVLDALHLTSKEKLTTTIAIEAKHRETTDKPLEPKALLEILDQAIEARLLKKHTSPAAKTNPP